MSAAHTPGPWVADGAEVWGTHPMRFNLTTCGTPMIAKACKHDDAERAFPFEENAHLIAAAPELLEACRLFVAYDSQDQEDHIEMMLAYASAIEAARAAIAKAEAA